MSPDEPTVDDLKRRQLESERVERRALEEAETDADAETHARRADKANYLRHKLEDQQRANREAEAGPQDG